MLTLARLRNAVLQATGLDALPHGFNLADTANEVQQMWAAEAAWGHLEGRTTTVALVAATDEYALPVDVAEVLDLWQGDVSTGRVRILSPVEFERYKGLGYTTPEAYPYGCVRWKPSAAADGEVRAHVTLYPPPGAAGTLTVVYRAGAVRLANDDDVLDMPIALEPVFLEYFRAYCRGTMLRETPLAIEMAAIRSSPMFRTALTAQTPHRAIQPRMGPVGQYVIDEEWPGDNYYARRF